jgi:hypothetical protein
MCASYRDKQKRSHFESFANKIFTGIREIKPDYAEKRAVWELFQNALDTIEENGIIEIAKTDVGLLFKHNGRPFTDDEFGGLIKQFSVGKAYGDNTEKVGQYGTGFISTHIYGKKITVNGSLRTDDGNYRTLQDFILDRDASTVDLLTDKLLAQDKIIDDLCEDVSLSTASPSDYTTFEYHANYNNHLHIDAMLAYVKTILPFIFCFNAKLQEVRLTHAESTETYKRVQSGNGSVHLQKNNVPVSVPLLSNEDRSVKVILGSDLWKITEVPKQFLYYPLMNTVGAGINFIIHANDFKPNKERDYLHKTRGNDELAADVTKNEELLRAAFDLVLKKVTDDSGISILDVSDMQFTEDDSPFEIMLKSNYIDQIKRLDRIEIETIKYSIDSFSYFRNSLLSLELATQKAAYRVLGQFRKLPQFEDYCRLSELVNNWNDFVDEKFDTLELSDIGQIVSDEGGHNYFYIDDHEAYQQIISEIAKDISLLNKLPLIPNIHGTFRNFESLVKWEQSEPSLISVIDTIDAFVSEKYIHDDFRFLENLVTYNREKFKDDFSNFCNDLIENITKGKDEISTTGARFTMLIESLKTFVGLNKKTQLNNDIVTFYERVFELRPQEIELSEPTVNVNYQPAIKLLAHLYVTSLQNVKITEHLTDLNEVVGAMFRNTNLKEELLHKLACIPDQNYVLKSQMELKRDEILDDDFKNQYDTITGNECRSELAFSGFEGFLQHSGSVSGVQLGGEIESSLNSEKKFIPVQSDTIDTVLRLIEKISEKPLTWGQWLPNINKVKEEILMHKFQNERTRSSLFSILTKNEKTIELLGELANVDDLSELIKKGNEKLQEENRKNNHLNYINHIGLIIQNLIEAQLGVELAGVVSIMKSEEDTELTTLEEQNGQDFIIYKNRHPIYFLEVKSKWDENGRFALSKNQTEKCAEKKDRYAVISVNVDRYKRQISSTTENISFDELKEFVKVNDELGNYFEKLISENITKAELNDPKLIEYRGSIPQRLIDEEGIDFDSFIQALINRIKTSAQAATLTTSIP